MVIQVGSVPTPRVDALQSDQPSLHTQQPRPETQGFAKAATATIVLLFAAVLALGGWAVVVAGAYSEPAGSSQTSLGAAPARQQAVDAALHDIGPPASHRQVRRENGLFAAGTVITYAPNGGAAAGGERTDLLSAWVERSAVTFRAAADVPTFLDCAGLVGAVGGSSRCTLAGELEDQRVEFTVTDDVAPSSCESPAGRSSGYRVELFAGSAPSGRDLARVCPAAGSAGT